MEILFFFIYIYSSGITLIYICQVIYIDIYLHILLYFSLFFGLYGGCYFDCCCRLFLFSSMLLGRVLLFLFFEIWIFFIWSWERLDGLFYYFIILIWFQPSRVCLRLRSSLSFLTCFYTAFIAQLVLSWFYSFRFLPSCPLFSAKFPNVWSSVFIF